MQGFKVILKKKKVVKKQNRSQTRREVRETAEEVSQSWLSRMLDRKEQEWHDDDYEVGFDGSGKDW